MLIKSRRASRLLAAAAVLLLSLTGLARADDSAAMADELQQKGQLRIAVYNDFPPYSYQGKGIDVDLAAAIAAKLGLQPNLAWFNAGEDMGDDLRNMVWKGHYLGTRPADVMMHVPVDQRLADANDKVSIFGAYHSESLAVARIPTRVPAINGSAAVALEIFTREKVGVERGTLSDAFLLGALNGRLRDNVVHYNNVELAVKGLQKGETAAVMAPRAELEAALAKDSKIVIGPVKMPELRIDNWALGMAVKADHPQLAKAIGKALAELQTDGTVGKIFARYGITLQTSN
jgi:ABC-type amino acid transport substrate-binding protein